MRDFSKEVEKAIDLLFKVSDSQSNKKKLLDKAKIVYLQVVLFKIPFTAPRKRKFLKLRHSLHGDDPEICLFVPNRQTRVTYKKTTDEFIDFCIDYYTEFLEKHKVKGIKTIMPLKQLMSEYGTYDLRRKLVQRFDLFLCKNSLLHNSRFLASLGKIFRLAKKDPLGVSFPKYNADFDPEFQKNVDRAIFTSSFIISRFSDNYSIPFGCLTNSKSELKENLEAVLNQLFTEKLIPGGFKNIRAMNVWLSQSKPIPLYISTELPVDLKTPRVKSKKKRLRGVEGELSTQPNKKVFVMPSGEVFVSEIKKTPSTLQHQVSDSENDESFVDESDNEEMEGEKIQNLKNKVKIVENEEESESEDDEEIEKKEIRLMKRKILNEESYFNQSETSKKTEEEEEKNVSLNSKRKRNLKCSQNGINKEGKKVRLKKKKF